MKKKLILTFLILSIVMFSNSGCMSPSGSTVTVTELFTAVWCIGCIFSHSAIDEIYNEYGRDKFVAIEYYVDSTTDLPYPRLACKESKDRMKWYMSDKGLPTAFFNGSDYLKGVPNMDDDSYEGKKACMKESYVGKMEQYNAILPSIQIWATCKQIDSADNFTISLSVKALDEISYSSLMLNIALIESNIEFNAINGDKIHNHVFREWIKPPEIKDTIGIPLTLTKIGDIYKAEFPFYLNTELYKKDLSIILFVQDMETKSILQGLEIKLQE
ncbi:MAG: hypothetical protein PHD83_03910 [Caldisericia bacterium]|nr:hypothetical protein [Caldisericia bacterium]